MIDRDELLRVLDYEPESGIFKWKHDNKYARIKAGTIAGLLHPHGYILITIHRRAYPAHRLAYLYAHGHLPKVIDHKNGIRHDNRLDNLRDCSRSQNNYNMKIRTDNKSGVKGVHWVKRFNKWTARIGVDGKMISLGYYSSLFDACCAMFSARNRLHGEYAFRG